MACPSVREHYSVAVACFVVGDAVVEAADHESGEIRGSREAGPGEALQPGYELPDWNSQRSCDAPQSHSRARERTSLLMVSTSACVAGREQIAPS